jgi:phosphoribosylformimino-5-aminoimidazole carboxamide ribotide isomerase
VSFTVFASVDIADGRCVRPLPAAAAGKSASSDDPAEVAVALGRAGARWLHIVDLDYARWGEPRNRTLLLGAVRAAPCPVQVGGGLRTVADVEEVLAAGATRALVGTTMLSDPAALRACTRFGDRVGATLDVRAGAWAVGTGMRVLDAVRRFERAGVALLVYTAATRDGTMTGPDLDGARRTARATSLPVVASGGIASLEDIRAVARLQRHGVTGAVVGRALYERRFSLAQANLAGDEGVREDVIEKEA